MGYKRHPKKRNVDPSSRQVIYSKTIECIIKKATEVSTPDDADHAGHLMLPTGELTTYASKGSVEDMFFRYIEELRDHSDGPLENEEFLCQGLKSLKFEAETPDKVHFLETLKRKLNELKWLKHKAEEKMRSCDPVVSKIYSNAEADYRKKVVSDALRKLEKLKAKLLEEEALSSNRTSDGASTSGRDDCF